MPSYVKLNKELESSEGSRVRRLKQSVVMSLGVSIMYEKLGLSNVKVMASENIL